VSESPPEETEPRVVVRDKRRIDPESGQVRDPEPAAEADAEAEGATPAPSASADDLRLQELTETLQRLKAEYDNYRRRAERERSALVEVATGAVLGALLPVLDDLERARAHGDLTGAFGSVGEALVTVVGKLGLEPYAASGDPFDPQIHEAVMAAAPAEDSDVPVVADVFRPGYRHAGRVLRAAQVSVSEPGLAASPASVPSALADAGDDVDEEAAPSA
jgi:molecular chaperone GrpE